MPDIQTILPSGKLPESARRLVAFIDEGQLKRYPELIQPETGRCYETSFIWVLAHQTHLPERAAIALDIKLVHGSIQGADQPRIGHAWVTFRGQDRRYAYEPSIGVILPEKDWRTWADARAYVTYPAASIPKLGGQHQHYGPWHAVPFGLDDCPHGKKPIDIPDDGWDYTAGTCPHGCTDSTLKDDDDD